MNTYNLPNPIKGLVIENDYTPDGSVRGLLKDHPELLADVKIVSYAKHRQQEIIQDLSGDRNTIIVASTFMYKDQLEDLTTFIRGLNKDVYCFVQYAESKMNDWLYEPSWNISAFSDYFKFIENIKALVAKGLVFEIDEDDNSPITLHDDCHGLYGVYEDRDRKPWTLRQILYSDEHEVFHCDNNDPERVANWVKK